MCWASDANSSEFASDGPDSVIDLMPDQQGNLHKGGTMRLGAIPAIKPGTKMEAVGRQQISERHRHRYEFNNELPGGMEAAGMVVCGISPDGRLVETVEIPAEPLFVACQFHPEFKCRPNRAHPLFKGFIGAAIPEEQQKMKIKGALLIFRRDRTS